MKRMIPLLQLEEFLFMSHKSPRLCLSSVNLKGECIASPAEAVLSDCTVPENIIGPARKFPLSFLDMHAKPSSIEDVRPCTDKEKAHREIHLACVWQGLEMAMLIRVCHYTIRISPILV